MQKLACNSHQNKGKCINKTNAKPSPNNIDKRGNDSENLNLYLNNVNVNDNTTSSETSPHSDKSRNGKCSRKHKRSNVKCDVLRYHECCTNGK